MGRMDLARLPHQTTAFTPAQKKMMSLLAEGYTPESICRAMARGNHRKEKRLMRSMLLLAAHDETVQAELRDLSKGEALLSLHQSTKALVKRAARGRVDAIKLQYELTGFHNPRVDHSHEHSGEVTIKLESVGRPAPVLDEAIVDADVVE